MESFNHSVDTLLRAYLHMRSDTLLTSGRILIQACRNGSVRQLPTNTLGVRSLWQDIVGPI